jgi:hypothetical protein
MLEELVLEPPERPAPGDRPFQAIAHVRIGHGGREVGHVLIGLAGFEGFDEDQAPVVRVTFTQRVSEALGPQLQLAGRRIDPPGVLRRVILQRLGQVAQRAVVRLEHPLSRSTG